MSEDDAVPLVKPVAPEEQQAESPPQDKFFLIYIIFLLQGVGCVFPWNAFVLAPDYFNNLYGSKTMVIISFVNNIPNVATLFLLMFVRPNLKWRVLLGYLVAWFILTIVPILALLRVEGTAGFAITLVAVAITATCTALMQGGVFGLAGMKLTQRWYNFCRTTSQALHASGCIRKWIIWNYCISDAYCNKIDLVQSE